MRRMDSFFNGLDCRLRVSGMVADSIMMGIVNSAMEDAYKRSCNKEGELERMIEKSRFCELAIMQLEWCLKYLQEEMDNAIVDSTCDRENLLCDLLDTRNRIHYRLEETNIAIAEKDVEIMRRKESEMKLRLALELKGEEVRSLHDTLERTKNETFDELTSDDDMNVNSSNDHIFDDLKCSVNKQLLKIRSKVEYGREILTNMMQNVRTGPTDVAKSNAGFEMDSDGIKTLHELHDLAQATFDFDEIVIDIDMLKGEVRSSFDTIESSISLFKAATEEKYWVWNMEREIANVIIQSFLKDFECECVSKPGVSPFLLGTNFSSFMDDIASLHDELEALASQITTTLKTNGVLDIHCNLLSRVNTENKNNSDKYTSLAGNNSSKGYCFDGVLREGDDHIGLTETNDELLDTSFEFEKVVNKNDPFKENPPGHFVADSITNHESTIQKKTQEVDWSKGRDKGCSSLRNEKTFDSARKMITKVISRLEGIKRESSKFSLANFHHMRDIQITYDIETNDKEANTTQVLGQILEKPTDGSCCHLKSLELFEEMRKLKEEKDEMEVKAVIMDDICKINYKDLTRRLLDKSFDIDLEVLVRENTFRVIFGELVKESINTRENYISDQFLKEEIYYIVFNELMKGIIYAKYSVLMNHPVEDREFGFRLFQGCKIGGKLERVQVKDSLLFNSKVEEGLEYSDITIHNIRGLDGYGIEESDEYNMRNAQLVPLKDDVFISVSSIGTAPQQLIAGEKQLGEQSSSFDGINIVHDPVTSATVRKQNRNDSCTSAGSVGKHWDDFHFMLSPIEKFSQMVMDFGLLACEKIKINILRLDDLIHQLNPISEQVNSIKRNEVLYHKAFISRCYNLQTAEAEVDLLGDEVDMLFRLLGKIYVALDHYSPVLQHYSGITEILRLIRREIYGEVTNTSRQ